MKATILQPTYLPWMGYFEMIDASDAYIMFDHVQFERKSWQQRNRIKTASGETWLSVPVRKARREARICDIKISYDHGNPLEKHWKTISLAYKKAPYFDRYKSFFENIYHKKYALLRDLNAEIIMGICDILGIKTKIMFSSKMDLNDQQMEKTEKIVNLCRKAGVTHLYDAKGTQDFVDTDLFGKQSILITFQDFCHPRYSQLWGGFIPYMSVIDLIFNEKDALSILRSGVERQREREDAFKR